MTAILLLSLCACSSPNTVARRGDAKEKGLELEVYFFAAGKADAILLTTEKSAVLIDCGKKGFGQTILEELNARGITRIDYLIITHFDQDHVGGAAKVINSIPIGCVVQNDRPGNSEAYEKYLRALDKAKVEPFTVNDSLTFVLDDVSFTVDPPQKDSYKHDNSNNSSLIVTVSCGEKTLLFMGDVQTERLKEFISTKAIDCDLLKAGVRSDLLLQGRAGHDFLHANPSGIWRINVHDKRGAGTGHLRRFKPDRAVRTGKRLMSERCP